MKFIGVPVINQLNGIPIMQKKALSLCIALTFSNNALAGTEIQSKTNAEQQSCPVDISKLTKEQRAKLPTQCLANEDENLWAWVAGGVTAAAIGILAIASNNGDDHHSNHINPDPDPIPDPTPDPVPDPIPDPTPDPTYDIVSYANGVVLDKNAKTVLLNGITYSYALVTDHYVLTASGSTDLYTDSAHWSVDANNNLSVKGKDADGFYWSYDAAGKFVQADANTKVIEGDGSSTTIDGGTGGSGKGNAGTIVDGDSTSTVINGGINADGGGTGIKVDGDSAVVDNTTGTTAKGEGSTGTDITGDNGKVINGGTSEITEGGTGTNINGDDAVVINIGDTTVNGDGSTGTEITGDGAAIDNTGDTTVLDGGTGTKIDGNDAVVDNKGDTFVDGGGSTGTEISGDNATINNQGNTDISDGGTGTKIDGNDADVTNIGDTTSSGDGSTGTVITGDGGAIDNTGDTKVVDGGTGTKIDGNDAVIDNKGNTDIAGNGSTGTEITGDGGAINNIGDTTVVDGGTGTNIDGNNAMVDNTGNTAISGDGSTGTQITGDDATTNNIGDTTVDDGATGTSINGKDATVDNIGDTTISGDGSTGTVITGDDATTNNKGDTDISGGGTGTNIDGDSATVNNIGDTTVSDAGSIGTEITGDNAYIDNKGKTDISGGGTGTKINGNDALIDNTGDTIASGAGSKAIDITGNGATVNNNGNSTISDGAIGTNITGNNATVNMAGEAGNPTTIDVSSGGKAVVITGDVATLTIKDVEATVSDTGSSLTEITGDDATAKLNGNITVKNGAHGIDITGNRATVDTAATIFVQDLNSIGITVTATNPGAEDTSSVSNIGDISVKNNATGVLVGGDKSYVTLDGNINVRAIKDDSGKLQLGDGVIVNGNNGEVNITGSVNISHDDIGADIVKTIDGGMRGVTVSGTDNKVTIGGQVNMTAYGKVYTGSSNENPADRAQAWNGVQVTGAGNTVILNGGINLKDNDLALYDDYQVTLQGIVIDGESTVELHGDSSIDNNTIRFGQTVLASVAHGGELVLAEDSIVTTKFVLSTLGGALKSGILAATDEGSTITNAGIIDSSKNDGGVIISVANGADMVNKGTVSIAVKTSKGVALLALGEGSTGLNSNKISVTSSVSPYAYDGSTDLSTCWLSGAAYGMQASRSAAVTNSGTISLQGAGMYGVAATQAGTALNSGTITLDGFGPDKDSNGNSIAKKPYTVDDFDGSVFRNAYYRGAAVIAGSDAGWSASVYRFDLAFSTATGGGATGTNIGSITVNNSGIGMMALSGGTVINQGHITLTADAGTVSDGKAAQLTGMGAMLGGVAINDSTGVIDINTNLGRAFYVDSGNGSVIVNKGTVNYNGTAIDNSDIHMGSTPQSQVTGAPSVLKGYRVGTNADGSAGKFYGSSMDVSEVTIDTGFTEGSSAKTETFDNVFQGSDIQGAENITADTVMWNAQGTTDTSGNVDVTMTKKDYTDVADASVGSVAGALEAGYTNNSLYQSLNLKTAADVTNAMKQLSGSNAVSAFNEAKVLSNRFTMLADSAMETSSGLGFNVVAKGDKRAELGNSTQFDMLALSQRFDLSPGQTLKMQYGIARLDGNGDVKQAGDNGLTGGYSQFFGLEHSMKLTESMSLDTGLRYDNHQLNSSRTIQYGSVNEVANADNTQQYMELKSQVSHGFALSDTLDLKPSAGVKLRHTIDGAVKESGASDYNLNMSSATETAVDAIAGLEMTYAGKNGWAATMKVEGGPNLSYSKSGRTASLQGASGQTFNVNDDQKGGGINGLATMGVSYNSGNTSLGMDAYNWQEDGANDKGLNLNLKVKF